MSERIRLTEDDFSGYSGDVELLEGFDLDIEIHTTGEAEPIINQILENQEKAEKWDKKIQFWINEGLTKDEAEKMQLQTEQSFIKVSVATEQENKQLKEDKQALTNQNLEYCNDDITLKQKLEQLEKRFDYLKSLQHEDMSAEDYQEYRILKEYFGSS